MTDPAPAPTGESTADPSAFRPLLGHRIVDLTASLAGPFASQLLGTLGAEIIKIEPPRGDDARHWKPPNIGDDSTPFLAVNGGKQSLALDLRRGIDVVRRLVKDADVFIQSLRPGQAEEIGLSSAELLELNPRLIYCSIGAYGRTGPRADLPGYDPLMQAAAGIMSVTGEPGGNPVRAGVSIIDYTTGLWAAFTVVSALMKRTQTGEGAVVDVALYDTALNFMSHHLIGYLGTGHVASAAGSSYSGIAPYQLFDTADGPIMIAAANNRIFRSLVTAVGLPELADDVRYLDNASRVAHREELAGLLNERLRTDSRDAWLDRLVAVGVPTAPVQTVAEVVHDPQAQASGMINTSHGIPQVGPAYRFDGERPQYSSRSPAIGEHSRQVLAGAGFDDDEIAALIEQGIVAAHAPDANTGGA